MEFHPWKCQSILLPEILHQKLIKHFDLLNEIYVYVVKNMNTMIYLEPEIEYYFLVQVCQGSKG